MSVRQAILKIVYLLLLCTFVRTVSENKIQIKAKNFGNIKKFVISTNYQPPKQITDSRKLNMDEDEDLDYSPAPSNPIPPYNLKASKKQTT